MHVDVLTTDEIFCNTNFLNQNMNFNERRGKNSIKISN